jgi:hypothetical protein
MCNYCGCREFPLVGELSSEHVEIEETAGELRRAIQGGRYGEAEVLLDSLTAQLAGHTAKEEEGLFAELRADGALADEVDRLCAEHDDIHGVLRRADRTAPDWALILDGLQRLHWHIDKEEHGLFPAAVITLPLAAWDRITPAPLHAD